MGRRSSQLARISSARIRLIRVHPRSVRLTPSRFTPKLMPACGALSSLVATGTGVMAAQSPNPHYTLTEQANAVLVTFRDNSPDDTAVRSLCDELFSHA